MTYLRNFDRITIPGTDEPTTKRKLVEYVVNHWQQRFGTDKSEHDVFVNMSTVLKEMGFGGSALPTLLGYLQVCRLLIKLPSKQGGVRLWRVKVGNVPSDDELEMAWKELQRSDKLKAQHAANTKRTAAAKPAKAPRSAKPKTAPSVPSSTGLSREQIEAIEERFIRIADARDKALADCATVAEERDAAKQRVVELEAQLEDLQVQLAARQAQSNDDLTGLLGRMDTRLAS